MDDKLLPAESMALTVALAQTLRGETPTTNVAIMCVLALARLGGRHDWTDGEVRPAAWQPVNATVEQDLRSRLMCVLETTGWDRPYDERLAAIRGMCDLTTNGLTATPLDGA